MTEVAVRPPNAVVLVEGSEKSDVPEAMAGRIVAATSNCLAIGPRSEIEGVTTIRVTDEPVLDQSLAEAFAGYLTVDGGRVVVGRVTGEVYATMPAPDGRTSRRVLVNDLDEPDLVLVAIDGREDAKPGG
jgi:hypothetical protein